MAERLVGFSAPGCETNHFDRLRSLREELFEQLRQPSRLVPLDAVAGILHDLYACVWPDLAQLRYVGRRYRRRAAASHEHQRHPALRQAVPEGWEALGDAKDLLLVEASEMMSPRPRPMFVRLCVVEKAPPYRGRPGLGKGGGGVLEQLLKRRPPWGAANERGDRACINRVAARGYVDEDQPSDELGVGRHESDRSHTSQRHAGHQPSLRGERLN